MGQNTSEATNAVATWAARIAAVVIAVYAGVLILGADPAPPRTATTVKTVTAADGTVTREETTKPVDESTLDRILSNEGDDLVRLAVVAAAAFLAAAVVQRVILGKLAFKAGGVELPDIAAASEDSADALAALSTALEEVKATAEQASQDAIDALALALEGLETSTGDDASEVP